MPKKKPAQRQARPKIDWRAVMREARSRFSIEQLRPGQREIICAALEGRNVLGILPTGAGKSLCYQLPALFLPKATVVVSPLIALMQDQQEKLAQVEIEAAKLDSTLTTKQTRETVENISEGEHELIYVTPERLENPEYLDVLRERGVSLVVVDEAHCVSQWGHDFRPAYLALRDAIEALGRPPVMALTATATSEVLQDILKQLDMSSTEIVTGDLERENIYFEVVRTVNGTAKRERIRQIVQQEKGVGIVYVATVRHANELHAWLNENGIDAGLYHAKLTTKQRQESQTRFMRDEMPVMVATKAFGLGIDKPDIRYVIHYQFPDSLESYYQEAGRAGRDGKPAQAILLFRLEDKRVQTYFLGGKYPRREEARALYEALLKQGTGQLVPLSELLTICDLKERRAKTLIALLDSAEIVARRRGGVELLRTFASSDEFERYLSEYEERGMDDRERLEQMLQYAQTTECRVAFLERYFSGNADAECDHCDNCKLRAEGFFEVQQPTAADTDAAVANAGLAAPKESEWAQQVTGSAANGDHHYAHGQQVKHRRFGVGKVIEMHGDSVNVAFPKAGVKTIKAGFLKAA